MSCICHPRTRWPAGSFPTLPASDSNYKNVNGGGVEKGKNTLTFSNTGHSCIQQSQNWPHGQSTCTQPCRMGGSGLWKTSDLLPAHPIWHPVQARGRESVSFVCLGPGCKTPHQEAESAPRELHQGSALAWPLTHPEPWANHSTSVSLSFLILENPQRVVIIIKPNSLSKFLTKQAHSKWANKGPLLPSLSLSSSRLSRGHIFRKEFKCKRLIYVSHV